MWFHSYADRDKNDKNISQFYGIFRKKSSIDERVPFAVLSQFIFLFSMLDNKMIRELSIVLALKNYQNIHIHLNFDLYVSETYPRLNKEKRFNRTSVKLSL